MTRDGANEDAKVAIERSRRAIDSIDEQILILLEVRARIAVEIGKSKQLAGVPVRDAAREAEILARLTTQANGLLEGQPLEPVFQPIFELMRRIEETSQESRP